MAAKVALVVHAAVFDMDGLLLDTEILALKAYEEACGIAGIQYQRETYIGCLGFNQIDGEQYFRDTLTDVTDADRFINNWSACYQAIKISSPPMLKPGVIELLGELDKRKIPAAVATSASFTEADGLLSTSGIKKRFKAIVTGDQVQRGKPEPDIYLEAASRLNVQPEHCLALEDSDNGVRAAANAGMSVIQIPDLARPSHDLGGRVSQKNTLLDVIDELPVY